MKRTVLSFVLTSVMSVLAGIGAMANDGVYCGSGNHLVPVEECDIAVSKEILTIDLCDDGFAHVDVYYELTNNGPAKTITMGFEADMPYMMGNDFDPRGIHPCIKDFTATMNGQKLTCSNAVVAASGDEFSDLKPLDLKKWKRDPNSTGTWQEGETYLVNGDDSLYVSYAYYFKAHFDNGKNIVHHTYRYMYTDGIGRCFEVPYSLSPCTRWANHQIDDFTLRISARNTAKHFFLYDEVFDGGTFRVTSGTGKVRTGTREDWSSDNPLHYTEVTLRNGVVELHKDNFKPATGMCIKSADMLLSYDDDKVHIASFYDRMPYYYMFTRVPFEETYGREAKNSKEEQELKRRIYRNLPYAHRGYVFKDKNLQRLFDSLWWYMPDPSWKMSADDFTKSDWRYINELGK